jgi:glycosyltransferase involved in cell wall biosynthesis
VSAKQAPLVSVVTPVYNGAAYLRECVESVLAQSYTNWRFTIVNNCSTDDTLQIAHQYARLDPRIRVHDNAAFLNIIDNHNHAFSLVDPEAIYCKPLMADDWLYPECIEKMVGCALAQLAIGLVCSFAVTEKNEVLLDDLPAMRSPTTLLTGRDACRIALLEYRYFFGSPTTMLIRADLVRKRTPFYNPFNLHADEESCYDILQESDFGFLHQVLAFIRVHEHSQTAEGRNLSTVISGRLYALIKYGRVYLSEEEFQRRYRERLKEYYSRLAVGALQLQGQKFWEFHRGMLARFGAPLDRLRLARAIAVQLAKRVTSPIALARSVAQRIGPGLRGALDRKDQ